MKLEGQRGSEVWILNWFSPQWPSLKGHEALENQIDKGPRGGGVRPYTSPSRTPRLHRAHRRHPVGGGARSDCASPLPTRTDPVFGSLSSSRCVAGRILRSAASHSARAA